MLRSLNNGLREPGQLAQSITRAGGMFAKARLPKWVGPSCSSNWRVVKDAAGCHSQVLPVDILQNWNIFSDVRMGGKACTILRRLLSSCCCGVVLKGFAVMESCPFPSNASANNLVAQRLFACELTWILHYSANWPTSAHGIITKNILMPKGRATDNRNYLRAYLSNPVS